MKNICYFLLIPAVVVLLSLYWPRGSLSNENLSSDVRIERDEYGFPYIYASTIEDAFFAYGYVVAEDRLWQMDISRRIALGRLSELVGERAIEVDAFMRNIRMGYVAKTSYEQTEGDSKNLIYYYTKGINYYASTHTLPIEYWISWNSFDDWEPHHSIAIMMLTGFGLNSNWSLELVSYTLQALLGPSGLELIDTSIDVIRKVAPIIEDYDIPEDIRGKSKDVLRVPLEEYTEMINLFLPYNPPSGGSNSWVIDGKYTQSGKPLLANDPHLGCNMPSIWYFVSINIQDKTIVEGMTIAGLLIIGSGRTKDLAWGITSSKVDGIDIFLEKTSGTKALYDGEWYEMKPFQETIYVKGKEKVVIDFLESKHGPIINRRFRKGPYLINKLYSSTVLSSNFSIKLHYMYQNLKVIETIEQFFKLTDIESFRKLTEVNTPGYGSLVVMNSEGQIAFFNTGQIPKRRTTGIFPAPGWLSKYDWQGNYDFKESPYVISPEKGYIVSSNNFQAHNYTHFQEITQFYYEGRGERIDEMIKDKIREGKKMTAQDMMEIQTDTLDVLARDALPLMLARIPEGKLTEEITLLKNWDFRADKDSYGASLFYSWMMRFARALIEDDISLNFAALKVDESESLALIKDMTNNVVYNYFVYRMFNYTRYDHWCDNKKTEIIESCSDLLTETLALASTDSKGKKWGELHVLHIKHAFTNVPVIGKWFDRTVNTGGTSVVPYAVTNYWGNGFTAGYGPGMRTIVDMSGESYLMIEAGESGNPLSSHYSDMLEDFHNGKYKKWVLGEHQTVSTTKISSNNS